jgi:hypothetical protein
MCDLENAKVAAALREAAGRTALMPTIIPANPRLAYHAALEAVEQHILALITPDAQAALDRYVKERSDEVVAEQREKDAKVAEQKAGAGSHAIAAAIRKGGE